MNSGEEQVELLEKTEVADQAVEFLREIFKNAHLALDAESSLTGECIEIDIFGDDFGMVLSDNARLLYAFNHVVNQIFYRRSKEACNFILDCSNYRSERNRELEMMAVKAAERVRATRMKMSLQPMPASERRIIHLTLSEMGEVKTESEGSGRYRRVVILPS